MKKRDLFTLLLVFSTFTLFAQKGILETKSDTIPTAEYALKVNNVSALLRANSNHFFKGSSHYYVPADSSTTTIFANALWIGGLDAEDSVHVAGMRFGNGDDFWTGPLSTVDATTDVEQRVKWNRFWVVDRTDIVNFIESGGEIISNSILNWPAHGDTAKGEAFHIAPFYDRNGNGIYEPYKGDHPLIYGDRCAFFVFNDSYGAHTETGGRAIGLEVHAMAYAFNPPKGAVMNNTIFVKYKLINRSSEKLFNTYVGLWTDLDIGYGHDDFLGCDVSRGTYYAFNGDSIDGAGQAWAYPANPPIQAVTILGGPYLDKDLKDNPAFDPYGSEEDEDYCYQFSMSENNQFAINGLNFGDGIKDNERFGMSWFLYTQANNGVMGDPVTDKDYYNLLHGIWKDGTPMRYGGNGHPSEGGTGPYCRFMFPSLTDVCDWGTRGIDPEYSMIGPRGWTFDSAGNVPTDVRGLGSMGPFTFSPGAVHELDFAFITIFPADSGANPFSIFNASIDTIRDAFITGITPYGQNFLTVGIHNPSSSQPFDAKINLFPNPTSDMVTLQLLSDGYRMGRVEIYDVYGKIILREKTNDNSHSVNLQNFASGLYLMKIFSDKQEFLGTYKVVKK